MGTWGDCMVVGVPHHNRGQPRIQGSILPAIWVLIHPHHPHPVYPSTTSTARGRC